MSCHIFTILLHPTLSHPTLLPFTHLSPAICISILPSSYMNSQNIFILPSYHFSSSLFIYHLISPCLMSACIGPCGGVPSRLHSKTVHSMMRNLDETRPGFDVMHEFSGKQDVLLSSLLPPICSPPCVYLLSSDDHALSY
jgi:hypothetical protein